MSETATPIADAASRPNPDHTTRDRILVDPAQVRRRADELFKVMCLAQAMGRSQADITADTFVSLTSMLIAVFNNGLHHESIIEYLESELKMWRDQGPGMWAEMLAAHEKKLEDAALERIADETHAEAHADTKH